MARIELFAVGEVKTAQNNNKYIVCELMKRNGLLTKRVKAVFFDKDVDIEGIAKATKGDFLGNGEISTIKTAPYEVNGKMVETATLFIPEGDEVDAILNRKKMARPAAPAAPAMVLQSADATAPVANP